MSAMTGPSDSGVQVDYALLNKLVDAVTLHVTGRPEWPDDWRNLRCRLADAIYPARRAALPVAPSDERLTQLARDCGLTWRLEGGPTRGICLGPGTAIEAFARALLEQAAQPLPVAALSDADRELMEQEAIRMRDALDAIYNHNEAARAAVVMHYGTCHAPVIAALRTPAPAPLRGERMTDSESKSVYPGSDCVACGLLSALPTTSHKD